MKRSGHYEKLANNALDHAAQSLQPAQTSRDLARAQVYATLEVAEAIRAAAPNPVDLPE